MITFASLVREVRTHGPREFLELHRAPVLCVREIGREEETYRYATKIESRVASMNRMRSEPPRDQEAQLTVGHVLKIEKRPGAAFPDRIGIGRAPNVDVRIPLPRVSKYHAFFTKEDGTYALTDAGSSNGTFVRGARLTPKQAVVLDEQAEVRFAEYTFVFYAPATLLRVLQEEVMSIQW